MIVAFVGPSSPGPAASHGLVEFRPPAQRGDVYEAAARSDVSAVCLIDGAFGQTASVLHKEILWALSNGVRFFGAASMGALRAVEMASYGAVGAGWIYEAYERGRYRMLDAGRARAATPMQAASAGPSSGDWLSAVWDDEALTDDDDVAVLHGPAELDHRPLTDAIVNLARTYKRACGEEHMRRHALCLAKAMRFEDRTHATVVSALRAVGRYAADSISRFDESSRAGYVDQKRADADELLGRLAARVDHGEAPSPEARPMFRRTRYWARLLPGARAVRV